MSKSAIRLNEILKKVGKEFNLSSEMWDDDYELRQLELRQMFELISGRNKPVSIGFKRLADDAIIPTKAHPSDSGFDLYASEDVIIEPGETKIIPTGIAVKLPAGYEAQVRPRSGVTAKSKLRVQLGTIDNGYTGEIGVIVDNIARYGLGVDYYSFYDCDTEWGAYKIRKGDRIAQLVIQPIPTVEAYEVDGELKETDRGEGGFGSSGVREDD